MKKEYIECGKIISAHGVRGLVKVESWCDTTKVLASRKRVFIYSNGEYNEHAVITSSASRESVIFDLGFETREAAQAKKNTVLYLKRCDIPIPRDSYLIADMIGLPVLDIDDGHQYGVLTDVSDGVQGKLYTVKTESGDVIIPNRPEFIKKVDIDKAVYLKPIPGFFD